MILVDTSIWVEHLRRENALLAELLEDERVLSHPFVVGELALGGTSRSILDDLLELPTALVATEDEVLDFIGRQHLAGRGIGYVDAHLLSSARLMGDARMWTFDKRLLAVAEEMKLHASLAH